MANNAATRVGRWVLITGGSGGIGSAAAVSFARNGYDIALHYATAIGRARQITDSVSQLGCKVELFQADLCQPGAGTQLAQAVLSRVGGIDVLINNASPGAEPVAFMKTPSEEFRTQFRVNVESAVELVQALLPALTETKGVILNVLSSYVSATPPAKLSAYIAAKHALLGLTRCLAVELAPKNVRVNAVAPGPTETAMIEHLPALFRQQMAQSIPLRRLGQPEDVAAVLTFLASPAAAYMTGTVVPVSGGAVMPA